MESTQEILYESADFFNAGKQIEKSTKTAKSKLRQKHEITVKIIKIVMIGLALLSFIKAIWVSLDIDESYAVALGYRLARGDRLISDMWEPHQLSAFIAALFTSLYVWIRGNTDYLIIYLRIVGILIHTGLGLILYKKLRRTIDDFYAFGIMILHLIYLPKWIQMPEFELMHYWCLLGIFLTLYTYFTGERRGMLLPFQGGILLAVSMLCYPTMILLYPFYILGICMLERQYCGTRGRKVWTSSLLFTLGALLTGLVVLGCLFSYMSFEQLRHYLSYIFLDTSHVTYTMSEKWSIYLGQLQDQAQAYLKYLLLSAGIIVILYLLYLLGWHINSKHTAEKKPVVNVKIAVIMVLLLTGFLMQAKSIYGNLFEDKNQFFFQVRYMAIILPAVVLGIQYYRRLAIWLYLCIMPGVLSVLAVLLVTNMDTNTTYAKAFLGVLGSLLIFYQFEKELLSRSFWQKSFLTLQYAAGGMVLAGLLVCRLVLIRVTGCFPVTLFASLEKMEAGPESGIYVLKDTAEIWNDNYRELDRYVSKDDKLLYIGEENLVYVKTESILATPSTQGTSVYNEMYLYYYEEHPERLPDVVVFDKTFGENPAYAISLSFSLQSQVFFDWIWENYGNGQIIETEHLIILKKEQ